MSEEPPQPPPDLPDWLGLLPALKIGPSTDIGDGMRVPTSLLRESLDVEIGTTLGTFSITPQLVEIVKQFSEDPGFGDLPTEPTNIERHKEDLWQINVGPRHKKASRAILNGLLDGTFRYESETDEADS